MSVEGDLRAVLQRYAEENKKKPFSRREWGMVETIAFQHEGIDWNREYKTDRKWWGEDVFRLLRDLGCEFDE